MRRFFDRVIRASFHDLALDGDPAAAYLADLLTRFARTDHLHPRALTLPRLEGVVDMMLEIQATWEIDTPNFRPEHEVNVRRHIGDYTLFMTGIFPERVRREATTTFYIMQGKRAYRFVAEHARASGRDAPLPYRRLSDRFESYAGALDYARRVHFFDAPHHPFFRLSFE
ncbi:MAG: hypothetical protein ACREF4_03825 [Gammaproteobacteria bacterium]